ncbi:MAG TPA: superoxide dismutase family protein [Dehalococcoidia bacterium]|nr:superoxide dismutase family protein [Dehalococcoidia bacterium]
MNRAWIVAAAASVIVGTLAYVTVTGEAGGSSSQEGAGASATLRDAADVKIGKVKLEQQGNVVRIKVKVDGTVAAGFHGFHVHAVGACVAPFTSAGGHFNPGAATHGGHAGDLPVLYIGADGHGEATVSTDRFTIDALFDGDGSAFILHAGRDNYANIPTDRYDPDPDATTLATGDAGARVACGVIEAS